MRSFRDHNIVTQWVNSNITSDPVLLTDIATKYDVSVFMRLTDMAREKLSDNPVLLMINMGIYIQVWDDYESFSEFIKGTAIQIIPRDIIQKANAIPKKGKPRTRLYKNSKILETWLEHHPPTQEKTYRAYYRYYKCTSNGNSSRTTFAKYARKKYPSIETTRHLFQT